MTQPYDDKNMITDGLMSQKFATAGYNHTANESANPQIRNEFMSILNEEHQIQSDIFMEMNKRGWYPTTPAEANKINETKTQFAGKSAMY